LRAVPRFFSDANPSRGTALLLDDRLIGRVLRHWDDMAAHRLFPSMNQIDPVMIGDDWSNCALVEIHSHLEKSRFVAVGRNLLPTPGRSLDSRPLLDCPCDAVLGIVTSYLSNLVDKRAPLVVSGSALHLCSPILYRCALFPLAEDGVHIDAALVAANYRRVNGPA
jgi:hypothetical protein